MQYRDYIWFVIMRLKLFILTTSAIRVTLQLSILNLYM